MNGTSLSRAGRRRRVAVLAQAALLAATLAITSGVALARDGAASTAPTTTAGRVAAPGSAFDVPPCDDPAWRTPELATAIAPVLRRAQALVSAPPPAWDAQAYTEFSRSGRREAGERMLLARQTAMGLWTLAECHEGQGRYLAPLTALLDDLARQPSWTLPAHDKDLGNLAGRHTVDLNVCEFGHDLAWALRLLGARLPASTRDAVSQALEARMFRPLRSALEDQRAGRPLRAHWWLDSPTNWNAVCVGGVTGTALTLAHPDAGLWRLRAPELVRAYLRSVRADGYSDEGPSYWNYGFGQYLRLRETLLQAGGVDIAADPVALALARYPARITMGGGLAALFGDARPGAGPHPVVQAHADAVLGRTEAASYRRTARAQVAGTRLNEAVWRLWGLPQPATREPAAAYEPCTLFADSGVAVFRPLEADAADGMAVSLRLGGSQAHAHDDAGSWAITVGPVYLAGDLGAPTYTADTFGPKRRENRLINSWGHPVPVVDGQLQQDATRVRATWTQAPCGMGTGTGDAERAGIDLRPVYAVDGLQRLERRFDYRRRPEARLVISDHLATARPGHLESTWVSSTTPTMEDRSFRLGLDGRMLRVQVSASAPFELKHERVVADSGNPFSRVTARLLQPDRQACIAWHVTTGDDASSVREMDSDCRPAR